MHRCSPSQPTSPALRLDDLSAFIVVHVRIKINGHFMKNAERKRFRTVRRAPSYRSPTMIDALFTGTQQRVIGLLFGQPWRSFYATELIGLTGGGSGAVQRELSALADSGLISVSRIGNQKHFQANAGSPLFSELCGIARKTIGLAEPLRQVLMPLAPEIRAAFVFGSVAKRQDTAISDIDLMLISDTLSYADIFAACETVGKRLGRSVNPTIFSPKDLTQRLRSDSAFLSRVKSQPKIWLIGGEDALSL